MSPPIESFARLAGCVFPGGKLRRAWSLAGGSSAQMVALAVQDENGRLHKMVVRFYGEGAGDGARLRREFTLLQRLHAVGMAVSAPYFLDAAAETFAVPCLVTAFVEGQPRFAFADTAAAMRQLATYLARIHTIASDFPFLPRDAAHCEEVRREMVTHTLLPVAPIHKALTAAKRPQPNAPVLLHGDFWPGNVLWQGEQVAAVVDWEDARRGDPLRDLAISRLDLAWIMGVGAMQIFTQQYQDLMPIDYAGLPYWDLCAALRLARLVGRDLAGWAAFFHPNGRFDITAASLQTDYECFVAQALAKL